LKAVQLKYEQHTAVEMQPSIDIALCFCHNLARDKFH